ncbi:MAG: O-antigen ligase family protein [Balneolaceae bacterium]|nr:O-antigen ligase family protein [Balneolaceae bacterium]
MGKYFYWSSWFLVITILVIAPSFSITGFSYFDQKKITQFGVLFFNSVVFIYFFLKYQLVDVSEKTHLAFWGILFLLLISSLLAPLPHWALIQIGWYLLILELLILFTFLYLKNQEQFLKSFLIGILLMVVLYSIRVYADYISGLFNDNWSVWPEQHKVVYTRDGIVLNPSAHLGFNHVRFFNHMQTWTLPLLVFAYQYFREKLIPGIRYLFLGFIGTWWMLVFAADARGTMVASLISILFIGVVFREKSKKFLRIYFATTVVGLLLYYVLFYFPQSGGREILSRFGDSGRLDVWLYSIQQIFNNPMFGLGPMHFSYMGNNPPWSTPHNIILQSAAEWGIPATLLAIYLVFSGFYKFVKQSLADRIFENDSLVLLRITLVTSLLAALTHSMVSGIFNSSLSQLIMVIVVAMAIGDFYRHSDKNLFQKRKKRSAPSLLVTVMLVVNSIFVGFHVSQDIPHLDNRKREFFTRYNDYTLYPRFWHQGMIYEHTDSSEIKDTGDN